MSSPQLHTQSQRRSLASRGRRCAIVATIAAGIATGSAAVVTAADHAPDATGQRLSTATALQVHVGATSAAFVRRMRKLEAAGYTQVGCGIDGTLMFNPRFHRYETVHA